MEKTLPAQHLLADLFGVDKDKLTDSKFLLELLKDTAAILSSPLLTQPTLTNLPPSGYTGVIFLESGHVCFRAHPEANYLAIDIFLQNELDPEEIFILWAKNFPAETIRKTTINRGIHNS
jgi:S-adenosylmethionine/arginine decarboxylase-like enzyme